MSVTFEDYKEKYQELVHQMLDIYVLLPENIQHDFIGNLITKILEKNPQVFTPQNRKILLKLLGAK